MRPLLSFQPRPILRMPTDKIRYDLLVQEALRGVMQKVLGDAARDGMPGEHHFFITFRTDAPGVRISDRTKERFPEEITIILQHQFWDLSVTEFGFEVGLSFSNVPERLSVPWEAVTGFFDPSVDFGLKFELQDPEPEVGANDTEPTPRLSAVPAAKPAARSDKAPRGAGSEPDEVAPAAAKAQGKSNGKPQAKSAKAAPPAAEKAADGGDAKVVSIDAFRKKT
jgi:hypothetical protein